MEPFPNTPPTNSTLPPPQPSEPLPNTPPTNIILPPPTPTTSILPTIPTVTQLSQASELPPDPNSVRGTIGQRRGLLILPTFMHPPGSGLCCSILALAKAEGFGQTLGHNFRTGWFDKMNVQFYADGGILCAYKRTAALNLRRKFKEAENASKLLYESNQHQNDPSGENDESGLPAYTRAFFEYFTYLEERSTTQVSQRASWMRNVRVNRSLISQQPALHTSADAPTFNPTTAPTNRVRGSGEIAGEVVINEIRVASSDSSVTNRNTGSRNTPRRAAPNDNRRGRSRNFNVLFPASLPPSTASAQAINVDRLERGYTNIADSINNLSYSHRIRKRIDINRDLQHNMQLKLELQRTGGDELMIATVTQTILDLNEERATSRQYDRFISSRINEMLNREISATSTSASSDNAYSDSLDLDNRDM